MYLRDTDRDAYPKIARFECAVRKLIRWELRAKYGDAWYAELGPITRDIEDRITSEKRKGVYSSGSSALSYLSLWELLDVVFQSHWQNTFSRVVKRRYLRDTLKPFLASRNKVAHFRPLGRGELPHPLKCDLFAELSGHYKSSALLKAQLSGAPERVSEQIEPNLTAALTSALTDVGQHDLWTTYGEIESCRSSGLFPGIGVFDRHILFELYANVPIASESLVNWIAQHDHDLTFCVVGKSARFVRFFVPTGYEAKRIRKLMRGLVNTAKEAVARPVTSDEKIESLFDFGSAEHLLADAVTTDFSFAF